jgi:uncharacterized protein
MPAGFRGYVHGVPRRAPTGVTIPTVLGFNMDQNPTISQAVGRAESGIVLRIKVVPGARRNAVVGMLGDRLKLAVAAPPQAGQANKAVCKLIARTLNVPARNVALTSGASQPQKTLAVTGLSVEQVIERIAISLAK